MAYNLTSIVDNSTTVLGFVQGTNNVLMLGWLGTFFLIGIAMILLFAFYIKTQGDVRRSIAATSFITFILAIFLKALNMMPDIALYISLILCTVTVAVTWKKT